MRQEEAGTTWKSTPRPSLILAILIIQQPSKKKSKFNLEKQTLSSLKSNTMARIRKKETLLLLEFLSKPVISILYLNIFYKKSLHLR